MSQFYGILKGDRKERTARGHKNTGLRATVNGWHSGAMIQAEYVNGEDVLSIYMTGGSNSRMEPELVAAIMIRKGRPAAISCHVDRNEDK